MHRRLRSYLHETSYTQLGTSFAAVLPMKSPVVTHIENRRLFDAAAGNAQLDERERNHLHQCELCQSVFYVFINQPVAAKKKGESAA
jgi:hypothetical protein